MKQEYSKKKKNTTKKQTQKQTHWMKNYIVLAVVLVLITATICATFAWYIDAVTRRSVVSFGEINIDDSNKIFETNTIIENVVPNKKIADVVSFSKGGASRDFYARIKMRYTLETDINTLGFVPWIAGINTTPVVITVNNPDLNYEYAWSDIQDDGYYYLVKSDETDKMFRVATPDVIYFTTDLKFPSGNLQLLDASGNPLQKGLDVNLSIIMEAVQADIPEVLDGSVEDTLVNISTYFSESEKDVTFVEYLECDGNQYVDTKLETYDGLGCEIKYETSTKPQWLYGSRENSGNSGFTFHFDSGDRAVTFLTATTKKILTLTFNPYQLTTLVHKPNGAYFIDGSGTKHTIADYNVTTSYSGKNTVYLFYVNGNPSGNKFTGKIYSAKFYIGDTIVLNLKPAKLKSNGKPVLFDTISGRIYTNNGTGDFKLPA